LKLQCINYFQNGNSSTTKESLTVAEFNYQGLISVVHKEGELQLLQKMQLFKRRGKKVVELYKTAV